jgi:hypothetical protein
LTANSGDVAKCFGDILGAIFILMNMPSAAGCVIRAAHLPVIAALKSL